VGRANGRLFLNNVSLGLYAQLVHRREHHRKRRNAFARLRAFVIVAGHRTPLGITLDGAPIDARVVLVSNNAYLLNVLSVGKRERLDEGKLHLYAPTGLLRSSWEERSGRGIHHRLCDRPAGRGRRRRAGGDRDADRVRDRARGLTRPAPARPTRVGSPPAR